MLASSLARVRVSAAAAAASSSHVPCSQASHCAASQASHSSSLHCSASAAAGSAHLCHSVIEVGRAAASPPNLSVATQHPSCHAGLPSSSKRTCVLTRPPAGIGDMKATSWSSPSSSVRAEPAVEQPTLRGERDARTRYRPSDSGSAPSTVETGVNCPSKRVEPACAACGVLPLMLTHSRVMLTLCCAASAGSCAPCTVPGVRSFLVLGVLEARRFASAAHGVCAVLGRTGFLLELGSSAGPVELKRAFLTPLELR